jgi:hypothetical protein
MHDDAVFRLCCQLIVDHGIWPIGARLGARQALPG